MTIGRALLGAFGVVCLAACSSAPGGTDGPAASAPPSASTSSSSSSAPGFPSVPPSLVGVGPTDVRRAVASPPVRVRIKAIGVDARVVRLGLLHDGTLEAPAGWDDAGWYAKGVVPGEVGPAIIAGHIDSQAGPAVFFRLGNLRRGDKVLVTRRDRRVLTFVVDDARTYVKSHFPTGRVYGPTPDAELKLITCTGVFDAGAHNYLSNLVVTAHLVSG